MMPATCRTDNGLQKRVDGASLADHLKRIGVSRVNPKSSQNGR
jgi:hypothetical protein